MSHNRLRLTVIGLALLAFAAVSTGGFAFQKAAPDKAITEKPAKVIENGDKPCAAKASVIINITSGQDDLFKLMAAFHLAEDALEDGRRVVLFFSGRGVTVPVKRVDADLRLGKERPMWVVLHDLMRNGAEVLVAAESARVLGMVDADFVDGTQIGAWGGKVFSKVDAGTVVFTY